MCLISMVKKLTTDRSHPGKQKLVWKEESQINGLATRRRQRFLKLFYYVITYLVNFLKYPV